VERERKRPGGTSKGMNVVKKAFGNKTKMTALIPDFIDGYNHGMNGVDLFDQSRKAYESLRKCFKTWKPRWHFFLDIAQCNSFRLSAYSPNDDNPAFKKYRNNRRAHYTYIKELCISLLQMGIDARRAKRPSPALIRQPLKNVATISIEHHKIMKAEKRMECVACKAAARSAKKAKERERKPLQELSANSVVSGQDGKKRRERERFPRTWLKCSACDIALCKSYTRPCWQEHLTAVLDAQEAQEHQPIDWFSYYGDDDLDDTYDGWTELESEYESDNEEEDPDAEEDLDPDEATEAITGRRGGKRDGRGGQRGSGRVHGGRGGQRDGKRKQKDDAAESIEATASNRGANRVANRGEPGGQQGRQRGGQQGRQRGGKQGRQRGGQRGGKAKQQQIDDSDSEYTEATTSRYSRDRGRGRGRGRGGDRGGRGR
jgi:hypothetical protein